MNNHRKKILAVVDNIKKSLWAVIRLDLVGQGIRLK